MRRLLALSLCLLSVTGCKSKWHQDWEGHVQVLPPYVENGQWWGKIGGQDWDPLPAVVDYGFQPQVSPESNLRDYVVEYIFNPVGENHVLYQSVIADDPTFQSGSRSNYFFTPDTTATEFYQKWRIFLQPDLYEVMSYPMGGFTYNWRQIWEEKSFDDPPGEPKFRMGVQVTWNQANENTLFWTASAEKNAGGENAQQAWRYDNHTVPVPLGEWFWVDLYLRLGEKDGRFICRINDEVIADHSGPTWQLGYPIEKWKLVSLYVDSGRAHGTHWQYVDSITFWCR